MDQDTVIAHGPLDISQVRFTSDVHYGSSQVWYLDQVRPFLENPDSEGPAVIARQYFHVVRQGDENLFGQIKLGYHIMEILPGLLGEEWVSFPGHILRGPQRIPYPSLLEVMHGEGQMVLQKVGSFDRLIDTYRVLLKPGDRILLPPAYGVILSNCGQDVLVAAHVRSTHTIPIFDELARHRGAAYYLGPDGARPNPHYRGQTPLRELAASAMAPLPLGSHDLYHALVTTPERFRFLDPH